MYMQPDKIIECFVPNIALSDHYPVCFNKQTSKLQTKKRNPYSIKYRSFTIFENSACLENLNSKIEKFKCSQSDSNMNVSTWNALFLSILNKLAPIKEKLVIIRSKTGKILRSGAIKQKASFVLQKKFFLEMLSMNIETIHSYGSMLKT